MAVNPNINQNVNAAGLTGHPVLDNLIAGFQEAIETLEGQIQSKEGQITGLENDIAANENDIAAAQEDFNEAKTLWAAALNQVISPGGVILRNNGDVVGHEDVIIPWSVNSLYDEGKVELSPRYGYDYILEPGDPFPSPSGSNGFMHEIQTNYSILWDKVYLLKGRWESLSETWLALIAAIEHRDQENPTLEDQIDDLEDTIDWNEQEISKILGSYNEGLATGVNPADAAQLAAAQVGTQKTQQIAIIIGVIGALALGFYGLQQMNSQ